MLSFLRASSPIRTNNAANNPMLYENGQSAVKFDAPESQYVMTHTIPPTGGENEVSIIQPPFHYHIHEDEYFNLQKGTAVIFKGVDPKPFAVLSEEGQTTATIPAGRYHRFENQSQNG
ncbi:hypothetical protein A1O7_08245 [Cladophialophora yegresii CBS 114405]|uniref:Cupin 2 conserved barrel domain-containing protein n=1 Tax=Cladophialophora yegresii CBS 114405 TaxID=1182544 RepID=W9VIH6_9EURO|nr:uncharacterized protein A1O7_08245 [Cladophialophora yegresii CBS 114405]EXJ55318.1 hypothetical protein A1O7_08245 [Cladophialophora yegresii CBS 114405]